MEYNLKKLKKLNININDLQEGLRNSGYFNFDDIEYALIETNGKLSVLPKSDKRPIIPRDLKNKTRSSRSRCLLNN